MLSVQRLIILTTISAIITHAGGYVFAVVPKRVNQFFDQVRIGCETRARQLENVTCLYRASANGEIDTQEKQSKIVEELLSEGNIDGLAISVVDETAATELIRKAAAAGVPTVTFDSDAPDSERLAYIGTDNYAFGQELGRVLLQLRPEGGKYGIIGAGSPNIVSRMKGIREVLNMDGSWVEVEDSPKLFKGNTTSAQMQMHELAEANPDIGAILPVADWPMKEIEGWQSFVDKYKHITAVVGDALEYQITLMKMGYVNSLVGQLPFEMGKLSMDKLLQLSSKNISDNAPKLMKGDIIHTSLISVMQIPIDMQTIEEEMNHIGSLAILGYTLFSIVALLSILCLVWAIACRKNHVVKASQPIFLIMICVGTLILGSTIIPLSIDDQKVSQQGCNIACMAVPWLGFIGFAIMFSALHSKTQRINMIFHSAKKFRRITVTEKDVLKSFIIIMAANIIILLCWTLIAPLEFERLPLSGTDNWNREIRSYYGTCLGGAEKFRKALPYMIPLAVINFGILVFTNVQAYQARWISTEFSESKYIAIAMGSMLQAFIFVIPLSLIINENPRVDYTLHVILIFIISMVAIISIFIPKIIAQIKSSESKPGQPKKPHQDPPTDSITPPYQSRGESSGLRSTYKNHKEVSGLKFSIMRLEEYTEEPKEREETS